MATQTINQPIRYAPTETAPQIGPQSGVHLGIPRYIFCAGDHIVPNDKHQLAGIGGWAGGYYLGPSQFPCAWRTDFFMVRGAITPLEKRAVMVTADHPLAQQRTPGVIVNGRHEDRPSIEALPGEDAALASSDDFRSLGFVELTVLRGVDWDSQTPLHAQLYFFPDWIDWLNGDKAFPVKIADYRDLIQTGINNADRPELGAMGAEMLESCRLFEQHAQEVINLNRELVRKGANDAGYAISWSAMARLYAAQLNIELEPESRMRDMAEGQLAAQAAANSNIEKLADAMLKDRELANAALDKQTQLIELLVGKLQDREMDSAEVDVAVQEVKDELINE